MYTLTEKEISIEDVFNAIAVDGYDHLREDWVTFKHYDGKIRPVGACLVGGAAINLGAVPDKEWLHDHAAGELRKVIELPDMYANEEEEVEIFGLANALDTVTLEQVPSHLSQYRGDGLGYTLIRLNDAWASNDDGDSSGFKYSYQELVDFARELMTPIFDKRIIVTQLDFTDASVLD